MCNNKILNLKIKFVNVLDFTILNQYFNINTNLVKYKINNLIYLKLYLSYI